MSRKRYSNSITVKYISIKLKNIYDDDFDNRYWWKSLKHTHAHTRTHTHARTHSTYFQNNTAYYGGVETIFRLCRHFIHNWRMCFIHVYFIYGECDKIIKKKICFRLLHDIMQSYNMHMSQTDRNVRWWTEKNILISFSCFLSILNAIRINLKIGELNC